MHILIVDDERNILRTTSIALRTMGHETEVAENGSQALSRIREHPIDAAFLDLRLGRESGVDVLQKLKSEQPELPIIIITAFSTVESAVEAMRLGAYDYINKPFVPEEIRQILGRLERDLKMRRRVDQLESEIKESSPEVRLQSEDPAMRATFEMAFRAAPSDASILLLGKSGTGKTVLARAIHERSQRSELPFVTVHCPSLSRELLESELFGHVKGAFTGAVQETWGKVAAADGGTLFLDEIGEMPMELQPKLLRLLQDREYERVGDSRVHRANIRVISATNRDLRESVADGSFREDLLYRLNVITVSMPSLVDRTGDIMPLAEGYLEFFRSAMGKKRELRFSDAVRAAFMRSPWPGNLREMRNVVERAVILARGEEIELEDLPGGFCQDEESPLRPGQQVTLDELEEEHIRRVLAHASSLDEAARILGIDTATLYRKRKRMGLLR
ncbi:MAG: sigma-54-dependent transcriptional regulator [Opitutales bacterium]